MQNVWMNNWMIDYLVDRAGPQGEDEGDDPGGAHRVRMSGNTHYEMISYLTPMVSISDGNSEIGAHVRKEF